LPEYGRVASEGQTVPIRAPQTPVAYGANGFFVFGVLDSSATCSNTTFGDPSPGNTKDCYVLDDGFIDGRLALEGQPFTGKGTTWYGNPFVPNFLFFIGSGTCSNSLFGGDPAFGRQKSCWDGGLTL
jgi:hypothetical protein